MSTEDDAHGGLEAVLAEQLENYGLPPQAGLTGLLRHLQLNFNFSLANWKMIAESANREAEYWREEADQSGFAAYIPKPTRRIEDVPLPDPVGEEGQVAPVLGSPESDADQDRAIREMFARQGLRSVGFDLVPIDEEEEVLDAED